MQKAFGRQNISVTFYMVREYIKRNNFDCSWLRWPCNTVDLASDESFLYFGDIFQISILLKGLLSFSRFCDAGHQVFAWVHDATHYNKVPRRETGSQHIRSFTIKTDRFTPFFHTKPIWNTCCHKSQNQIFSCTQHTDSVKCLLRFGTIHIYISGCF